MFADKLKKSLLQAAIQGRLTEQLPTDGDARDLLKKIRAEKVKLLAAKKIKAEKPLPPITDDEIPFELPANWCWCRLGEVCNYGTNETIQPSAMQVGKLLIELEDVEKDSGKLINRKNFDGKNANSSKNIFRRGNVLFGKLRVYLNKVIIADADGYCSSEILPLDFGKNILNRYAQIVLMSPPFLSYANACSYGTKMPRLGSKAGQLALFPLPPLAEQLRIVAKLDALLTEVEELAKDERELNLHVKNFPRKMKNSLLQAAIQGQLTEQLPTDGDARDLLKKIRAEKVKLLAAKKIKAEKPLPPISDDEIPFELPANWCWCRLGEISTSNIGLTYSPQDVAKDGVIVLRSGNITNGKINYNDLVKVNIKIPENKLARVGDILICARNGSKRLVGKAALIDRDGVSFGAFMALIRSQFNQYILRVINSPYFRQTFLNDVGTTTINQITQSMLKNFLIPLPPLAEQERIVERLNELLPLCEI